MEPDQSRAGAGTPTPLQPISPERVNQQRDIFTSVRNGGHSRDSSVNDKINQFNTMASPIAKQSRQLERKANDAAYQRAMLAREEAETEMRRYKDEARNLRTQIEEGKIRERKVGERLETIMENYGRAKETFAHTQALWEKEIRRARKETFKSQSVIVKLQEELKSVRQAQKSVEETLEREKERSQSREQEAFTARYSLVGCQEQLEQALERIKVLEQERDAFKSLAKSEDELAQIAAEGRLPLPKPETTNEEDDEFASPKKKHRVSSLSAADIRSSAASEAEIEELTRLWQWEKQRADRAADHVEYLEAECHLRACSCMKKRPRASTIETSANQRISIFDFADAGDEMILSEHAIPPSASMTLKPGKASKRLKLEKPRDGPRRSTIFVPEEGVFRTVSQEIADAMEVESIPAKDDHQNEEQKAEHLQNDKHEVDHEEHHEEHSMVHHEQHHEQHHEKHHEKQQAGHSEVHHMVHHEVHHMEHHEARREAYTGEHDEVRQEQQHEDSAMEPPTPIDSRANPPYYARTPSVEPPSFAMLAQQRTSLLSLLDAPHEEPQQPMLFNIPTTPAPKVDSRDDTMEVDEIDVEQTGNTTPIAPHDVNEDPTPRPMQENEPESITLASEHDNRPHTSAAFYATTTTRVPLREESAEPSLAQRLMAVQKTPTGAKTPQHSGPFFDTNNPALTPTMTREQALAQIRERRGRARSAQAGAITPRKLMVEGAERRDVSAPVGRTPSVRKVRT